MMFTTKLGKKESFEKPSEIFYADSPKALTSLQGIRKIPVSKVESMTNFTWTETTLISQELSSDVLMQMAKSMTITTGAVFQRMVQQIKENSSKLVLTNMGKYGHGVFSCADIPANTFIASSTGLLKSIDVLSKEKDSGTYSININGKFGIAMDARNNGNIARFFQHLPSTSVENNFGTNLNEYTFTNTSIKPRVATENIELKKFLYKNHMVVFIMTTCPIAKFDMLGWDYSAGYWESLSMTPVLFLKNGQNIAQSEYKKNNTSVHVKYLDRTIIGYVSVENIETLFQKKQDLVFVQDNETVVTVSPVELRKKYNANPRSMFLFFDSPNKVIKPKQVKTELNRIGACLNLPNWEYNSEEISASLNSPNSEKLILLGNHLKMQGCSIQYLQDNTQLIVNYPESDKLQKIEAMSTENQVVLQVG